MSVKKNEQSLVHTYFVKIPDVSTRRPWLRDDVNSKRKFQRHSSVCLSQMWFTCLQGPPKEGLTNNSLGRRSVVTLK